CVASSGTRAKTSSEGLRSMSIGTLRLRDEATDTARIPLIKRSLHPYPRINSHYSRDPQTSLAELQTFLTGKTIRPLSQPIVERFGIVRGSLPGQIRQQVRDGVSFAPPCPLSRLLMAQRGFAERRPRAVACTIACRRVPTPSFSNT